MARPKKSTFYHIRYNTVRINENRAAEIIGVDVDQIREWDKNGAPPYVETLLLLWDKKHINAPGWDGWTFSRGALMHKNKRWRAEGLLEQRDREALIFELECKLARASTWRGFLRSRLERIGKPRFKLRLVKNSN